MSGLYLPGVEMPKPGHYEAVIIVLDESTAEIAISPAEDDIGYWKEYPLIPVPEHGRLGDLDELLDRAFGCLGEETFLAFQFLVNGSVTIIPADTPVITTLKSPGITPPLIHVGYKKGEEAVDNDKTPQMLQKILDSLPENSPLVPYIKDGGDLALVCVFLALLLMPPDNMARIANEMMEEIVPTPTVNPADPVKEEQT